jgi:hypothetical protein
MGAFADPEVRKKAAETRKFNAEQKRLKKQNQAAGTATTEIAVGKEPSKPVPIIAVPSNGHTWQDMPLDQAIEKYADMKRELDRAGQVILARQSREPVIWTCWVQSHKDIVTRTVLAQCKKNIPDGKWVSKDDGAKDEKGNISPAVTCSMMCATAYLQRPRKVAALSRH